MTSPDVILALLNGAYESHALTAGEITPNITFTYTQPNISEVHAQVLRLSQPLLFIDADEVMPGENTIYRSIYEATPTLPLLALLAGLLAQTQLPADKLHLVTPWKPRNVQTDLQRSALLSYGIPPENIHQITSGDSLESLEHAIMKSLQRQ